jgi:hypothetical protein
MIVLDLKAVGFAVALLSVSNALGQRAKPYVLLPESSAQEVSKLCSREGPKVDGTWTPTAADLQGLEGKLSQLSKLKSNGGMTNIHIANPARYYRQYVAVVVAGRKLIYINAFSGDLEPGDSWHKRLENICDGGLGTWGALYDPETRVFSELKTNGVA